jgi:hypothetical protein
MHQELQRLLSRQSAKDREAGGEWESEDRELTIILLKSYAGESIDEIELVDQVYHIFNCCSVVSRM